MQENDINKSQEEEMEIDLLELAMTLWNKRKNWLFGVLVEQCSVWLLRSASLKSMLLR